MTECMLPPQQDYKPMLVGSSYCHCTQRRAVLKRKKKKKRACNANGNERSRGRSLLHGHGTFSASKVGGCRLAVGGGRQRLAVVLNKKKFLLLKDSPDATAYPTAPAPNGLSSSCMQPPGQMAPACKGLSPVYNSLSNCPCTQRLAPLPLRATVFLAALHATAWSSRKTNLGKICDWRQTVSDLTVSDVCRSVCLGGDGSRSVSLGLSVRFLRGKIPS